MRFFDTHLHLPSVDRRGLDHFLNMIDSLPNFIGGCLVLNFQNEVDLIARHINLIPPNIALIPFFDKEGIYPQELASLGWYKIHPSLQKIDIYAVPELVQDLQKIQPRGLMVHCFPWGPELEFNVSLPLVISLASALPNCRILATHGGGYESWAFRAHAGHFGNVHFDFSMTLDYYENSDLLRPLQRYLRFSSNRVHFGSDWPSGDINRQLLQMQRLAGEVGMSDEELELLLLTNAFACWPEAFDININHGEKDAENF